MNKLQTGNKKLLYMGMSLLLALVLLLGQFPVIVQADAPPVSALAVKLDGVTYEGTDLQAIITDSGKDRYKIDIFEFTDGTFTPADWTYLQGSINDRTNRTSPASVIFAANMNITGAGLAFTTGFQYANNANKNYIRFECPGVETISGPIYAANAVDQPVAFWFPDVKTLANSALFDNAVIDTLYFPKLETIGTSSFQNCKAQYLILTGNTPVVTTTNTTGASFTTWVPENKLSGYTLTQGSTPDEKLWLGRPIKTFPSELTDLQSLVAYTIGQIPGAIALADADKITFAERLAYVLPLNNGLSAPDAARLNTAQREFLRLVAHEIEQLPVDMNQVLNLLSVYKSFSAVQRSLFNTLYPQKYTDLLKKYGAVMSIAHPDAQIVIYTPEKGIGLGNTVADIIQNMGLTTPASRNEVRTIYLLKGSFTGTSLFGFKASNTFNNLTSLIATDEIDINGSMITPRMFGNTARTLTLLEMPSVTEIQSQGLFKISSTVRAVNAEIIGESIFQDAVTYQIDPFLPRLSNCESKLPVKSPLIMPVLQSGKNVYSESTEKYICLPSLETVGADFFKNTTALKAAWLPQLKTINGAAFSGSAIKDLYLQSAPPEITGSAPFSGLDNDRTVYVPSVLLSAYTYAADSNDGDGKWYGWEVKPIGESTAAAALLNAYIALLPPVTAINLDYSNWLRSLERAKNSLSGDEQSRVDSRLDGAISAVNPFEIQDGQSVIDRIEALKPVAELTLADRAAVRIVRSAYDLLTIGAKSAVTNYTDLVAAESVISGLSIVDVRSGIADLPSAVTIGNINQVRAVYSDYLELTKNDRTQISQPEENELEVAMDAVVALEQATLSARIVDQQIAALPAPEGIQLSDENEIKSVRAAYNSLNESARAYITRLDTLAAAEAKITELKNIKPEGVKTIYISVEKFTLGQGYVKSPVAVMAQEGDNAAKLITQLVGSDNYKNDGTVDAGFYLKSIKDNDSSSANIPEYILQRIDIAGIEVGTRRTTGWLGEFDYTDLSGWMFTVNNELPSAPGGGGLLGAADFTYAMMQDGDVMRWQFTVYGYGADLGFGNVMAGEAFINTADKSALTAKIAQIDASSEKPAWMAHADYAETYSEALHTVQDTTSSQTAVDASLQAISSTPSTEAQIGTVKVTVRDVVPRRQVTTTTIGIPVAFKNLTGLGDYENQFGVLLDEVEVPLIVGMTVQQAIRTALANNGYQTYTSGGVLTGIGPVTTPDKSATLEHFSGGDAGDRSKWIMSRNREAIFDVSQPVYANNGDELFLEYSVDGGYDVQCYGLAHTYFDVSFTPTTRVETISALEYRFIVPEGTQTLAISYSVKGSEAYPDAYSRYKTLTFESNGIVYRQGDVIPVTDEQLINVRVFRNGGGATHNPFFPDSTITTDQFATLYCTVVLYTVIDDLIGDIQALPALEDLDYDVNNSQVMELMERYNILTAEDKARIPAEETDKLNAAYAEMIRIFNLDEAAWRPVYDQLNTIESKLNSDNYLIYEPQVQEVRQAFNALTERQKTLYPSVDLEGRLVDVENRIKEYAGMANFEAPLGIATDYKNDFMLTGYGFNIDVCQNFEQELADKKLQEVVFFDTPRISQDNCATNHPFIIIEVKDPNILEVRNVPTPNPNSTSQMLDHYYLVGKQPGTTTFTVRYPGFMGQTPEMAVNVNSPTESQIGGIENTLTDINAIANKYDTWYYQEGTPGAEFTFKVNGTGAQVKVFDYLQDTFKTYSPDAEGKVTVLLTDGYNPIVVTSLLEGQTFTQAYGVRSKVVKYTLTNVTDPESNTFQEGDTICLKIKGLNTPIYKISRIYNPADTRFKFDTDLPRYTFIESGGGQYTATTMEFELTAAGEFTLTNGRVTQSWFGMGLFSELPVGAAPPILNAGQPNGEFSNLPDVRITVEENPDYIPALFHPEIEGGNTVRAGATVTLKIHDLDVAYIKTKHTTTSSTIVDILEAYTVFKTDIPGLEFIKSNKVATSNYNILDLKEVSFIIPADSEPGKYHIGGGYVDVTSGPTWWKVFTVYYSGKMADLTITVASDPVASDQSVSLDENSSLPITLTATATEGCVLTYTVVSNPAHGVLSGTAPELTYTPNSGYTGPDSFTFKANDGTTDSNIATISIDITPPAGSGVLIQISPESIGTTECLNGFWGSSPNDIFAVGFNGLMLHYKGSVWSPVTSNTTNNLNSIWGSSATDIFAVGNSGTILHYDGSIWSAMTSNVTIPLFRVWGTAPDDVFAVGNGGTILHYNGNAWSAMTSGVDVFLYGLWGKASNDVFVTGSNGTILHYDGANWSAMTSGVSIYLKSVWGSSSTDVYVVGLNGTILHYDGTIWSPVDSGTTKYLLSIWGSRADNIFVAGLEGTILNYDGVSWNTVSSGTTEDLREVWGNANGIAYFGGVNGTLLKCTFHFPSINTPSFANNQDIIIKHDTALNITLTATDVDSDPLTYSIVAAPSHGILSGTAPALIYTPNTGYTGLDSFTFKVNDGELDSDIATVNITVNPNAAPVANDRSVTTYKNTPMDIILTATDANSDSLAYSVVTPPSQGTLTGTTPDLIYTPNSDYTGADSFTFKANDGEADSDIATVSIDVKPIISIQISPMDSGTTNTLNGIWGISATDVFVAGDSGTILHYDGTAWSPMATGTTNTLNGIWGSSATDVFATGNTGTILHYDGSAWSPMDSGTTKTFYAIWGISATDVFVAGDSGTILHYDGSTWSPIDCGAAISIRGIWGSSATDIFVSATSGNIRHYDGSTWSKMNSGLKGTFGGIWGTSATDVFIVANKNILHYDGFTLSPMDIGTANALRGIWGNSASDVFASGASGTILHYDGAYWKTISSNTIDYLTWVWGDGNGIAYFTGVSGTLLKCTYGYFSANTPPVANDQDVNANRDVPLNITLTATDAEGTPLTYSIVDPPTHGVLSGTASDMTYTPNSSYFGPDSFTFKANDGEADSNIATVHITVIQTSPYATEVVSYSGPLGASPYDEPNSVLGKPSTRMQGGSRVKLVEPAYGTYPDNTKLITSIESGGFITVKFDHHVMNDPNNPYGIDLLVFGNAFFSEGAVSDASNMDTYMFHNTASIYEEPVTVAVSQDGETWYTFTDGPFADSLFPTQAYQWDSVNHTWTDIEMDFTKPVNPALTLAYFNGLSGAQAIALYNGSGGGTGYDLSNVGLDWIQYVKVTSSWGEVDAFADVAPVTSSAITVDLRATGASGDIFSVSNYAVPTGTVTEDGITINNHTAMGALVYYCQQHSIDITVQNGSYGLYVYQIGSNTSDQDSWMYYLNGASPMTGADQQAIANGDSLHWVNYTLGYYSLSLSLDKSNIQAGDNLTATASYTNGDGQTVPASAANVYVSNAVDSYGNPVAPGMLVGQTESNGQLTFTWNQAGTFYPYASWNSKDTVYQYPAVSFTCTSAVCSAWDVNQDGSIDVLDMILVGNHFGETGDPGWIAEDVKPDGSIDVLDLILIGNHFGE
jgi:hypothetical protein